MRIWIVIAVLAGLGAQRLPAQTPETAVEQAMRGEKGKPKQTYGGRYAALWHREADGKWRLSPADDAAGVGGRPLSGSVLPRGH